MKETQSMIATHPMKALLPLFLALAFAATAADTDTLQRLDQALQAAAQFEYGGDSGPLQTAEQIVVESVTHPEQRAAVETRLLQALGSPATRDAKEFLCRQLFFVGTAHCVPQLEALLTDPGLSHIARYTLGRIADPAADAALLRALGKTSGKIQVGILNTLGNRRCASAVPDMVKLLQANDPLLAGAAAAALGNFGNADAVQALEAVRPNATVEVGERIDDALLACADQLLAKGQEAAAARIYEKFYAADQPRHLRIAALRGLVGTQSRNALNLLTEAIKGSDPDLQAIAIGFARTAPGRQTTLTLAGMLPSLPADGQALLLNALSVRGDNAALPVVMTATKSDNESIRIAACEALGNLGDASAVDQLVRTAATARGLEQQAARASLLRVPGDHINGALIQALDSEDSKLVIEVMRALAGRRATEAVASLLKMAVAEDNSVRRAAFDALGSLASDRDLSALVALAVKPKVANDRLAIEEAIASAFHRVPESEKQAAPVLAALTTAPTEAKPTLLRLLGRAATPAALDAVRAALNDGHPEIVDAAVRTLADWPNPAPVDDLLEVVRTAANPTHKVLALRGYVRLAALTKNPTVQYVRAMELATRPEDKKLVLGGLGTASSLDALKLVQQYLNTEALQAEAALAMVQIANRLRQTDAEPARAAVKQVLATVNEPNIRKQAQDILNEMDQYEGYILVWQETGPFKARDGQEAYNTAYTPEKPSATDVKWKPLTKGLGSWDINLESVYGSLDHCAAYMKTRVWSPLAQEARLEMGADDALKVWFNGKLVQDKYQNRGLAPRQDIVKVQLQEGWNDLLLKVVDHEGGWQFCCRVRRPDGGALEGLKVAAE